MGEKSKFTMEEWEEKMFQLRLKKYKAGDKEQKPYIDQYLAKKEKREKEKHEKKEMEENKFFEEIRKENTLREEK